MDTQQQLQNQRQQSIDNTHSGPPARTINQFFGVGPITDVTKDEYDARALRFSFDSWLEKRYPKTDDKGKINGNLTSTELARGMHRGYPADKVLADMMQTIHSYFEFPSKNKMAVGLGGGHSGFTVCAIHLVNANTDQQIFIDTPRPESEAAVHGGFFRQSWGTQLLELQRYASNGDENRIHFSETEGRIPSCQKLEDMNISLFFGVGHETTGATAYTEEDLQSLLAWIEKDALNRHAVIDGTSLLGAMPWQQETINKLLDYCCIFTPFQKAIGGIAGYFLISITPQALRLIESNIQDASWAIPRQLKIAVPEDPKKPLTGKVNTSLGPIYDPQKNVMQGGIINTFSTLAFAETTFGLSRVKEMIGDVTEVNKRSIANRQAVNDWVDAHPLFSLGVTDPQLRGAAVTLLKVEDSDITDPDIHANIIAKSKQLLGYEGITHPNGDYEPALDVARYVNAFPGTPGDYRAWIGGIREEHDIIAMLDNLEYAYQRAKIVVLEEILEQNHNITFTSTSSSKSTGGDNNLDRTYTVLIADLVGLIFDSSGKPDHSEVKHHIEQKGGMFHESGMIENQQLETGKIHFFYQPNLSTEEELLHHTDQGQYDAVIAAATFLPATSVFNSGGVRIGAGTGNMSSASWGGANGESGIAPLMNTPSFNSRATAQMAIKALLKVLPDLPTDRLHQMVVNNNFDTGKNLCEYPTTKLEGKRMAILGYGNIGREVAKLAQSFGIEVTIYAREKHKSWIESEGFNYASTPIEAAQGANIISPHTGLGQLHPSTGEFENAGLINGQIFNALADGAILINYDRGEIVDADSLDAALTSGKIGYAAIDADIFKKPDEDVAGPMKPYLSVEQKHRGKLELLPHAAADTEHVSRVDGAKQAVDQIVDAIVYKKVTNLKGALPTGYINMGAATVKGVGKVTHKNISEVARDQQTLARIRRLSEDITAFWGAVEAIKEPARRQEIIDRYAHDMIMSSNTYRTIMEQMGLNGPYSK